MARKKKPKSNVIAILNELAHETPINPQPTSLIEAEAEAGISHDEVRCNRAKRLDNECGKVCYSSQGLARKAIKTRKRCGSNAHNLREYFCPTCHAWHMASLGKHEARKKK